MRLRFVTACLAVLIAATAPASSAPDRAAAAVAGLQAWLDGTQTLEARFRQSLVSGALGTSAIESGRLYLERPGRLRWDYLVPERKIALLVGDRTELFLEEDRQLMRGRLNADSALFPRLLAGRDRVTALFQATVVDDPGGSTAGTRLKLVPREHGGSLTEVTLLLRTKDWAIEGAEVLDEMGNRTTYVLSGVTRNRKLPAGIFAFEPPPGTEVVDEGS
jgi:outer membrane lipoprotein carrier protein